MTYWIGRQQKGINMRCVFCAFFLKLFRGTMRALFQFSKWALAYAFLFSVLYGLHHLKILVAVGNILLGLLLILFLCVVLLELYDWLLKQWLEAKNECK